MFQHAFQSGAYLEIFDAKVNKEKDKFYQNLYKVLNPQGFSREYDKAMKGYLVEVLGNSRAKLQFPKEEKQELALVQHFLVLQILIPIGVPFGIEITVSDTNKNKRRLHFTSSVKTIDKNYFHSKIPVDCVKRGVWLNLSFDILSFFKLFKGQTFRSIDSFVLSGGYKLRKIFTMKSPLLEYDPDGQDEPISNPEAIMVPKTQNFPPGVTYYNQCLSLEGIEKQTVMAPEDLARAIDLVGGISSPEHNLGKAVQIKSLVTDAVVSPSNALKSKARAMTRQEPRPEIKKPIEIGAVPRTAEGGKRKTANKENATGGAPEQKQLRPRSGIQRIKSQKEERSPSPRQGQIDLGLQGKKMAGQLSPKSQFTESPRKKPAEQNKTYESYLSGDRSKSSLNPWAVEHTRSKGDFNQSVSKPNLRYSIHEEEIKGQEESKFEKNPSSLFKINSAAESPNRRENPLTSENNIADVSLSPKKSSVGFSDVKNDGGFNPLNSMRKYEEEYKGMMEELEAMEDPPIVKSETKITSSINLKSERLAISDIKNSIANIPARYSGDLEGKLEPQIGGDSVIKQSKEGLKLSKVAMKLSEELRKQLPTHQQEEESDHDELEDSLEAIRTSKPPVEKLKESNDFQANTWVQQSLKPFTRQAQPQEKVLDLRDKASHSSNDLGLSDEEAPEPMANLHLQQTAKDSAILDGLDEYEGHEFEEYHSDGDEGNQDTLNVVYDPVLNCYYHPPTNTYFELKQ